MKFKSLSVLTDSFCNYSDGVCRPIELQVFAVLPSFFKLDAPSICMCNSCINLELATAAVFDLKCATEINVCFRRWEIGYVPLFVSHLNADPQLPNDKLQAFWSARLVFGIIVRWKCRSETAVVPSALQVGAPCGPGGVLKGRVCYKSADLRRLCSASPSISDNGS